MAPGAVATRKRKTDSSSHLGNTNTTKQNEEDKDGKSALSGSYSAVEKSLAATPPTGRQNHNNYRKSKKEDHSACESSMAFLPDEILGIIMRFLIGGGSNDLYNLSCVCKRFTRYVSKKVAWFTDSLINKGKKQKKEMLALRDQVSQRVNIKIMRYQSGMYKGEFGEDGGGSSVPNGMGVFNKTENDVYTESYCGKWQEGRKHGNGMYVDRSGRRVYFGVFREGQRHGFGSSFTKNEGDGDDFHNDYIGGYENNQRCGIGLTFLRSCNGGGGKVRVSRYGRYNNDKPIGYHMRFKEFFEGTTRTKTKRKLEYFGTSEMTPSSKRLKTNNDHDG